MPSRQLVRARSGRAEPTMMTVKELSSYLRVHPSTVYRLLKDNKLPGFKVGESWRFSLQDIKAWREAQVRSTTKKS
jgi:excisionase family DNA binding protein